MKIIRLLIEMLMSLLVLFFLNEFIDNAFLTVFIYLLLFASYKIIRVYIVYKIIKKVYSKTFRDLKNEWT